MNSTDRAGVSAILASLSANIGDLDEAVDIIERECGEPVSLVEHRSDLTYWTARVRA